MTSPNRPPSCDLPPEFYQANMRNNPNLKPCPMCGGDAILYRCESHFVSCDVCEASGGDFDESIPDASIRAIRRWNSIPRRSEVLELLNKLEFAMLTSDWNRQDELEDLKRCADKLRKEIGE